ncbi:hypothetical protein EDB86DRAFT_2990605 [Lactarius hatsudake]|nr:hypothetical protein EDB86DRAFT_2990605 [Lactarius hatsudake]
MDLDLTAGTNFYTVIPSARNSITFTLSFDGNIPHHLINSEVPIEMSIHLLPEFSSLRPIIQTTCPRPEQVRVRQEYEVQPANVIPIPFLPLTSTFNKVSPEAWASLASQIEQWLIHCIQDQHTSHWKWGVEVFWAAFLAAYPCFPLGEWPRWDTRIPLAGPFIESQLLANDFEEYTRKVGESTNEDLIKRREELWEEFCTVVKVLYPYPIQDCEATV